MTPVREVGALAGREGASIEHARAHHLLHLLDPRRVPKHAFPLRIALPYRRAGGELRMRTLPSLSLSLSLL